MPLAEVVMDTKSGHLGSDPFARLLHANELQYNFTQGFSAIISTLQCDLCHCRAQHAGRNRMPLDVISVEQAFRRCSFHYLGQLPTLIHCILHTSIEALSAHRGMHMCGVAGQENPALAISRRLPRHVGEPGNPSQTMDSVICSPYGDECFAEIAQRGLGRGANILFSHHDAYGTFVGTDYLAVANFVRFPAKGMDTKCCAMDAQWRLLRHLGLGENAAGRSIPSSKLNARSFADHTAASIAPGEIACPQRRTIGQFDGDASVVLRETR